MSEKIQVACVDCARHELIKVSIQDLNGLGVLPLISDDFSLELILPIPRV